MPERRPNVVVFLTDQQRADSTGVHGNPLGLTPNFDRFASHGTFVADGFTCQPVCAPARSVLQTGQYPTVNGVYRNALALAEDAPTIARDFAAAGYDTAYIGKWHLAGYGDRPVPPELRGGYDHWLAADAVELMSDAYQARLYDADGELVSLPGYRADAYVDAAIDYLSAPRERPFLLFLSLLEPHHQNSRDDYPAPEGYRERYEGRWIPPDLAALGGSSHAQLAGYWGMVERVDEAFGRLLDTLTSNGLRDSTIVAYTSDHGCHFKTRNGEYKRSVHDASLRVPMALGGPGFDGGGRVPHQATLVDLPPTLLAGAGLPVPERMQGRSLLDDTDWPEEIFFQISESYVGRGVRTDRWKYGVRAPDADGWDDPAAEHYVESELYDLFADPHELTNLADDSAHADVRADLRARLIHRMTEAGEEPPRIASSS